MLGICRALALASLLGIALAHGPIRKPGREDRVGSKDPRLELVMVPELPVIALPSPYLADGSVVVQIACPDGGAGSAVYLGSGRYLTAAHVVTDEKTGIEIQCLIAGQPIAVKSIDRSADYALIEAAHYPAFHAVISCERLAEGEEYFATGYASGNPWPVTSRLRGTGAHQVDGTANTNLTLVNGMSGGAVVDRDGVDHAIIDWRDEDGIPDSGVVEIADTPLCKGKS